MLLPDVQPPCALHALSPSHSASPSPPWRKPRSLSPNCSSSILPARRLAYEVATNKPIDPDTADLRSGCRPTCPARAPPLQNGPYGAMYPAQIVGGPDWLIKDAYNIEGKAPTISKPRSNQ